MNVVRNKINRVNKVYNKIMMLYNKNKKYKDSKQPNNNNLFYKISNLLLWKIKIEIKFQF